jgi:hypothetical protein
VAQHKTKDEMSAICATNDTMESWFPSIGKQGPFPDGQPKLRLLCFPSSGTMESLFTQKFRGADKKMNNNALMDWAEKNCVEILAVQLPGRGKRHKVNAELFSERQCKPM